MSQGLWHQVIQVKKHFTDCEGKSIPMVSVEGFILCFWTQKVPFQEMFLSDSEGNLRSSNYYEVCKKYLGSHEVMKCRKNPTY
jgi:hypothetical protein